MVPVILRSTLLMGIPSAVVMIAFGFEAAIATAVVIGVVWSWRRTLVFDVFRVRGVIQAAARGDRQGLVRSAENAAEALLRFRDFTSVKLTSSISHFVWGAGAQKEAERLIAHLPIERYVGIPFWHLLHTLTLLRLKLGAYDDAERALDRCGQDAPNKELDREHRYFRGLVEAATGKPKRALNRMEGDEAPERDVVALHAYCALGKEAKALEALERLKKEEAGELLLEQIAKGHGPGQALVLRVLGKEPPSETADGPYR